MDNLTKFLNDSLNGLVWEDDSRIAWTLQSKSYVEGRVGETILFVTELNEIGQDYQYIIDCIREHITVDGEDEISSTTE